MIEYSLRNHKPQQILNPLICSNKIAPKGIPGANWYLRILLPYLLSLWKEWVINSKFNSWNKMIVIKILFMTHLKRVLSHPIIICRVLRGSKDLRSSLWVVSMHGVKKWLKGKRIKLDSNYKRILILVMLEKPLWLMKMCLTC